MSHIIALLTAGSVSLAGLLLAAGSTSPRLQEDTRKPNAGRTKSHLPAEQIVYVAQEKATNDRDWVWDIWAMNADGTQPTNLTKSRAAEADPVWSPDRKWIAYTLLADTKVGSEGVYVMKSDGSARRKITPNRMVACAPSWSPDGKHLAFSRVHWAKNNRGGSDPTFIICRIDIDGTHLQKLCEGYLPAWSPDGKTILYRNETGVHLMNSQGRSLKTLVSAELSMASVSKAAWSPDGARIAYVKAGQDEFGSIWVMNADGSGKKRLTDGKTSDSDPEWAADGTRLYFTRKSAERLPLSAIWAMNPDGTEQKPLTTQFKAFTGFGTAAIGFAGIGIPESQKR